MLCTDYYAKRIANKTNGLVDITLFILFQINQYMGLLALPSYFSDHKTMSLLSIVTVTH